DALPPSYPNRSGTRRLLQLEHVDRIHVCCLNLARNDFENPRQVPRWQEGHMYKTVMNRAIVAAIAVATVSAVWLVSAGPAPSAAPARVHFAGCIKAGVEHSCLIVESGGQTYNVSGAKTLKPGQFAAGSGVPGQSMSFCQQGVVLDD